MLPSSERAADSGSVEPEPRSSQIPISQRLLSFPVMIGALLIMLTVLTVRGRFNDPDLWWHLKIGEIIWNTYTIPTSDLFSFTTNNHEWVPHEWLAEVSIYSAYKVGGYSGLMVWLCVVPSLLFVTAYALCSLYSRNVKVALLGALATWLFATVGLSIRPHLIGYLLLTCQLLVVHLGRTRDRRWFLCLPVIFALWVNCHGSFFFGLMVLAIYIVCSFLDLRAGLLVSVRWDSQTRHALLVGFTLSVAALLINPVGVQQAVYPLDVMLTQSTNLAAVSEWQPPAFKDPRDLALVGMAALVLLLPLVRRSELRLEELLLVGMAFGMAIRHSRMMFVFGILAAPVICRLLSDAWDGYDSEKDRFAPNAVMLAITLGIVVFAFPKAGELQQQVEKGNPVKAVEFLQGSGMSGRMLNEYVYGGYLIWAAPERKVFIDGRADIFDWTGVLREYGAWAALQRDPKVLLDKYAVQFCLLSADGPMSKVLPYLAGWKMIYSDTMSQVFARVNTPQEK